MTGGASLPDHLTRLGIVRAGNARRALVWKMWTDRGVVGSRSLNKEKSR